MCLVSNLEIQSDCKRLWQCYIIHRVPQCLYFFRRLLFKSKHVSETAPVPVVRLRCEATPKRLGSTERAESLGMVLAVRSNYAGAAALLSNDGIRTSSRNIIFFSNMRRKSRSRVIPKYNFFLRIFKEIKLYLFQWRHIFFSVFLYRKPRTYF
jgi:hypothetical protein